MEKIMAELRNKIVLGDCVEVMKKIPDNSIDSIVTDPPYGLKFMGKDWDRFEQERNSYYDFTLKWAKECLRVLKPGGYLLAFGGARTYHRLACAIEDAGFEVRDMVEWVYGSGFPKSMNVGEGMGTALKPAHEPICMARKPISEKSVVQNIAKWGTGGLNIDACRVLYNGETPNVGGRANHGRGDGYGYKPLKDKIQPNTTGRFPANLIHDGSQLVLEIFPETKSSAGHFDKDDYEEGDGVTNFTRGDFNGYGDRGSAARFFYCAKASKAERELGLESFPDRPIAEVNKMGGSENTMKTGSGNERRKPYKNTHPTVKPIALMRYLVRLVTPKGGLVLDPFIGSGTTALACIMEGFDYLGIEKEPEYVKIAEARIKALNKPVLKQTFKQRRIDYDNVQTRNI